MDNTEEDKKIRVLALCDAPNTATGFAQVSRNILNGLAATGKYDIDVIGINHHGNPYDPVKFPYKIHVAKPPNYQDMYGRGKLLQALNGTEEVNGLIPPWDIVFTIQDPFIIEGMGLRDVKFGNQLKVFMEMWKRTLAPKEWFTWIGYFPVDSDLKENWVDRGVALPDYPVAYCEWGKQQILKHNKEQFELAFSIAPIQGGDKFPAKILLSSLKQRIGVIPHGVDTAVFKPLPKEETAKFKKAYFKQAGLKDDTFLVVNVSRNQPRKDLARTLAAFAQFKQHVPNAHLYLHCNSDDVGGSIHELARSYKLSPGPDYSVPSNFSEGTGYPIETVNRIYNAADLCITTTLGEGWGFITTEAMATKTPIIAPNITSILDIFNSYNDKDNAASSKNPPAVSDEKLRGIGVKAGSTTSEFICLGIDDNERIRPLTNVDDMVQKMIWVYNNRNKQVVKDMVERAYTWVQELSWENVVKQWDDLFMKAYNTLEKQRAIGLEIDKTGRNDPCPCASGDKFKNCHGSSNQMDKYKDWMNAAK